jgi:hypothetical protein
VLHADFRPLPEQSIGYDARPMTSDPDFVPPRWHQQTPLLRGTNRWVAARPQRLIAVWTILFAAVVAGLVLLISGVVVLGAALLVTGGLNLAVDLRYVPRAVAASRRGNAHRR